MGGRCQWFGGVGVGDSIYVSPGHASGILHLQLMRAMVITLHCSSSTHDMIDISCTNIAGAVVAVLAVEAAQGLTAISADIAAQLGVDDEQLRFVLPTGKALDDSMIECSAADLLQLSI